MKRVSLTALCCATLLCSATPMLSASNRPHADHKGTVPLPVQTEGTAFVAPAQSAHAAGWREFMQRHGEWTVLLDKATGTPHQAFGKPVRIPGYERITADNIEAAAETFLRENAAVLRIDPTHLRHVRSSFVNDRWYVSYVQVENGVEVLLSGVELRIFANGNVMAFGVDYYPDPSLNTRPTLAYSSAVARAADGMQDAAAVPAAEAGTSGSLYILPVKRAGTVAYRLVYKIPVHTADGRYLSFVDAHSGDIVWRYDRTHRASTEIGVRGGVKRSTPLDEEEMQYFPYQHITIGGQQYTTDEQGKLNIDIQNAGAVTATFDGPYAVVRPSGRQAGEYSGTLQPGVPLSLEWDDNNSTRLERNMFYHANRIRRLYKEVDPNLVVMDRPIYITLDYAPSQSNAFSNGDSITFLSVGDQSVTMADGPSVLYHEYGHSLNHLLYQSLGREEGMINHACHEGTADIAASLLLDESRVGVGVFADNPDHYIRDIANDMIWPDSAVGESHNDGLILAGAFWDLRKSISREHALKLSHFAKYGLPDDPDDGVAFSEWFIETLIADDNDGDLTNGTPHAVEIITAFNRHRIGTDLLLRRTFTHTPLPDTKTTDVPYAVEFTLEGMTMIGGKADSVAVVYMINGTSGWFSVPAVEYAPGRYRADIPAQPRGSYVQYYVRAWDPFGKATLQFSGSAKGMRPYSFLVGYKLASTDKFEQNLGWTTGSTGDDATTGRWERAIPEEIDFREFGGLLVQPGTDYSEQGTTCYVTGNRGGFNFQQELLNGTTTLVSPEYDLSALEKPVVRFYRWFALMSLDGTPAEESGLRAEFSSDGGESWTGIEATDVSNPAWEKVLYRVPEEAQTSTRFRVRFVAYNYRSPDAFIAPLMKALIDDVDILTANDVVTGVDDVVETGSGIASRPNPFSSEITIRYDAPAAGSVDVAIYSVLGEEVVSLSGGYGGPGRREVQWNGCDAQGRAVAPGMYIVQVRAGEHVQKQIIVRY